MKKLMTVLSVLLTTSFAQATTFHTPDQAFLEAVGKVGITQANWDHGKNAKLVMQNAYRFTHYVELEQGSFIHDLGEAKGFNLSNVQGYDLDGALPMDELLRDRLNTEALVILKNGKLIDEYYWSGMDKDSTHLQMSVTKSFTSITLQTLVAEGKVNMNSLITDYLPELKASPSFAKATVQEVADMRSGIKIIFSPGRNWDERMSNVQEWNGKNLYPELRSIIDYAKLVDVRTDYAKGEMYDYQDINTEMLGMIIARVTDKPLTEAMENRLWKKVGFGNKAKFMSNSTGEAVGSGGLNVTPRDIAIMMDVLVNDGKNRNGDQIVPKSFVDSLLAGNDKVRTAWTNGSESKMATNGWYKDQIRTFDIRGHKFLAFVGIHGQVTIGEPSTGIVFHLNAAQDEMQAKRTVALTFLGVVPTLLEAIN
ncbi:beta-lactamase family protein [Shewanella eurypsychrophilus]|uniref:Beta-lactamase family protein n=1 Tax=Shewanella eurypsychrophilus TaxID=2593656 RepID=A0ABX6VAD4_9GAMM|nr:MULTISPECIES: serine hydrolase [Shewanella]QFU23200.1 serine hydrolase [Shewanella sp. YLB-09]QPG58483.1 beta-lactamase family protein [Shewanella eurypsychrophilus]